MLENGGTFSCRAARGAAGGAGIVILMSEEPVLSVALLGHNLGMALCEDRVYAFAAHDARIAGISMTVSDLKEWSGRHAEGKPNETFNAGLPRARQFIMLVETNDPASPVQIISVAELTELKQPGRLARTSTWRASAGEEVVLRSTWAPGAGGSKPALPAPRT
jgi:hypothetical protein